MLSGATGIWKVILSILFFPIFFQKIFLEFSWAAQDPILLMIFKRIFLLLPILAVILACWVSMASLISVLGRHHRSDFMMSLLVTWWDLGRSIFFFWGGVFRMLFYLIAAIFTLVKFIIIGLWTLFQDIILVPFRIVRNIGSNVLVPGIPWIAVVLTVVWAILEAGIFTFVCTPLVMDTLSNMTGAYLSELGIRIPLFVFLFIVVLGSYAVLANLATALREKKIAVIMRILIIEVVVLFVEVMFLYREFVDSLMPWFAQHANFEPGLAGILAIAGLTWFGIRGVSWFLFAAHGTPTIMSMIQGTGLQAPQETQDNQIKAGLNITKGFIEQILNQMESIKIMGEDFVGAFLIPPLQLVAASINFCTLLLSAQHLFELPFKTLSEVMSSKMLLHSVAKKKIVTMPNNNGQKDREDVPDQETKEAVQEG